MSNKEIGETPRLEGHDRHGPGSRESQPFRRYGFGIVFVLAVSLLPVALPAETLSVPEAIGPIRELSRALDNLHSHVEHLPLPRDDIQNRVLASYFWHMAEETRTLLSSASRGVDKHELLAQLSHLQGWFQYTAPKVRASLQEAELLDKWSEGHGIFVQVASLMIFRLDPSRETPVSRRHQLDSAALDMLQSSSSFDAVVERERGQGKLADPHSASQSESNTDGYWKDPNRMGGTPSKWRSKTRPPIVGSSHTQR